MYFRFYVLSKLHMTQGLQTCFEYLLSSANGNKKKHKKFHMNIRKHFFTVSTGTGCSGRFQSLHSWRYWQAIWTWSWTTCFRWPCLSKGFGPGDLQAPLPTSTLLWLCYRKFHEFVSKVVRLALWKVWRICS